MFPSFATRGAAVSLLDGLVHSYKTQPVVARLSPHLTLAVSGRRLDREPSFSRPNLCRSCRLTANQRLTFIVPGDDPPQLQGSPHLDWLRPYGEVTVYVDRPATLEDKLARVSNADGILNTRGAVNWPGDALRALPRLRMITTCSIGTDMIDLQAVRYGYRRQQPAGPRCRSGGRAHLRADARCREASRLPNGRAEGGTMGAKGKHIPARKDPRGRWGRQRGSQIARLGNALGTNVIAWTFNPSPQRASALRVRFVEFDDLLRESDVVSLNLRLSDETAGLVGERELGLMKPSALLVNGGRGELVDTVALVSALSSGRLAGAALDVFDIEPLPPNHPILGCEQVVLTSHMADQTPEGIELLNEGAVDNVIEFLEGTPQNVVTP